MRFPVLGAYLLKDLAHDRARSLLTVISLTAVIVSYLATTATSEVLLDFGSQPSSGSDNLLIMSDYALDPMQSNMDDTVLQTAADVVRQGFGPDSVRRVSPLIYRTLRFDNKRLQIIAVPLEDMVSVHHLELLEGQWPAGDGQVVATQEALQLMGWETGDGLEIRDSQLLIVGRVHQEGARMAAVWMDYPGGQALFNAQDSFQIGVLQVGERLDPSAAQASLEADAGMPGGYVVYLEQQLYAQSYRFVADLLKVALVLAVLALGVVCFGTYNSTRLTLMERRRELAILQTLGFPSRVVRAFLLARTLLQTLAGFLLAWAIMVLIVRSDLQAPIAIEAKTGVLRMSPGTLGLGLVLTLAAASLGVWLVSRAQDRQNLADQLRE